MRSSIKKVIVLLSCAALTAGVLTGCGSDNSEKQTQSADELMKDTEDGAAFIEEILTTLMTEIEAASGETEDYYVTTEQEDVEVLADPEAETEEKTKSPDLPEETEEEKASDALIQMLLKDVIDSRIARGEKWAVAYEDLNTGERNGYQENEKLQSASVIKLFIMGTVYRYMVYPEEGETEIDFGQTYDGELRKTIENMITVSDNSAANFLVERLGKGNFAEGAKLVNQFCKENGYEGTELNRRFLGDNKNGDNFTTAADSRKFLSDIYNGKLISKEASEKMLAFVKAQTRKNKIPSGLPKGFTSGNKTGEMPDGNLGCIENDSAIVFPPDGQGKGYILTVMSTNLGGRNSEAISAIGKISAETAAWYQTQYGKKK